MAMLTIEDIDAKAEARFRRKVKVGSPSACWPWTAYRSKTGYGYFKLSGKVERSNQLALILAGIPRPSERHCACHHCDNPSCCNPAHLFWAEHLENIADRVRKGRSGTARGEASPRARITAEVVLAVRSSTLGCVAAGKQFGISPRHVNQIRKRECWAHI